MKQLFSVLPVLLLFQATYAQCDSKEFGFKGAVHKIIHKRYKNPVKISGEWVPNGARCNEMIQVYNQQGNFDTFSSTTTIHDSVWFVTTVVYHYSNHIKTGWSVYDMHNKLIGKGLVNRINQTSYRERQYNSDEELNNETVNYLDKNQNLYKMRSRDYSNTDTTSTLIEYILIRPEQGPATMQIENNITENKTDTTRYNILQTDMEGNPTETLAIWGKDTTLSVRKYFYRK